MMSGFALARHRHGDGPGGWLVRADEVLAALDVPPDGRWVAAPAGPAVVLHRLAVVRPSGSIGMDIAWCRPVSADGSGTAVGSRPDGLAGSGPGEGDDGAEEESMELEVRKLRAHPAGRPVLVLPATGVVVVAAGGAFDRWALQVGDQVTLRSR